MAVTAVCARSQLDGHSDVSALDVIDVGGSRWSRRLRKTVGGKSARPSVPETRMLLLNDAFAHELHRLHKRRPIDAVYERYSLWTWAGAAFAQRYGVPHLLEVNAPLLEEQKRYRSLVSASVAADVRDYVFASANRVLVPSRALVPHLRSNGVAAGNIRVVPNAADPHRFRPRRESSDDGFFRLGFLGSLKPWHGLDLLLRAFLRLHRRDASYRLVVIGDGPLRPELERRVADKGAFDAVEFTGAAPYDRVPELLASIDVALAPYEPMAGFYFSPIKIFEYMAAGLPIVAASLGQIEEVLDHRRSALLVRPGSVVELADAVARIRSDPKLGDRLGRNARKAAVARHTWQRNARRVVGYVETLRTRRGVVA